LYVIIAVYISLIRKCKNAQLLKQGAGVLQTFYATYQTNNPLRQHSKTADIHGVCVTEYFVAIADIWLEHGTI